MRAKGGFKKGMEISLKSTESASFQNLIGCETIGKAACDGDSILVLTPRAAFL